MSRVTDCAGLVTKADFVKLGQDLKLLDFGGAMGEKRKQVTPKKERRRTVGGESEGSKVRTCLRKNLMMNSVFAPKMAGSRWFLCCCHSLTKTGTNEGEKVDKVQVAFNIWDTDGDGFLTWEDFQQVIMIVYTLCRV